MIDLLGLVMITSVDLTALDYLQRDSYALNNTHYDVSEYYKKAPTLTLGGFIPINDNLRLDFNVNTGTHTKALTATGSGSVGVTYTTQLKDPSWGLTASLTASRSADVRHSSCSHGDKYNREFSCGIGGTIVPFSMLEDKTGEWSEPSISLTLTHRF